VAFRPQWAALGGGTLIGAASVRFHLIDRIDEWVPAKRVRARKLTSYSEDYWEQTEAGLLMPAPFLWEALCQAGSWLIMISTDRRKRAALLSIGSVDWLGEVGPGAVLEMVGECESFGEETAVVSGHVSSDGVKVLEAKDIMCALIDAGDLADLDDTERLQKMLTRVED
jgi:3-hydroxyacyl-[acyl-carrier-protein] dehydratase